MYHSNTGTGSSPGIKFSALFLPNVAKVELVSKKSENERAIFSLNQIEFRNVYLSSDVESLASAALLQGSLKNLNDFEMSNVFLSNVTVNTTVGASSRSFESRLILFRFTKDVVGDSSSMVLSLVELRLTR